MYVNLPAAQEDLSVVCNMWTALSTEVFLHLFYLPPTPKSRIPRLYHLITLYLFHFSACGNDNYTYLFGYKNFKKLKYRVQHACCIRHFMSSCA